MARNLFVYPKPVCGMEPTEDIDLIHENIKYSFYSDHCKQQFEKYPEACITKIIMTNNIAKPILYGIIASAILLGIYFIVLTLVSGWSYALSQFATYWYFIISLVVGFGIQIALYQYIKILVHSGQNMGKVVGISGTTSTVAMVSCCAHYLVNLVPILGITGLATFVSQYQIKIFWVGLAFNIFGIVFISDKIIKFKKHL